MNTNQIEMIELSVSEIKKTETPEAKKKRMDAQMADCLKWLEAKERKEAEQEMKEKVERFNAKYFPNNDPRVWA